MGWTKPYRAWNETIPTFQLQEIREPERPAEVLGREARNVIRQFPQRPYARSETVSFRIDGHVRSILEEEARKTGVSLNTLVSQMFLHYAMWGRYADRLKLIPVSKDLLRDLFAPMDPQSIADIAKRLADSSGREHILFQFQEMNLYTFLQFLNLWSSHFDAYEHRFDGKTHFYTIHHDINMHFSIFIKEYLTDLMQNVGPKQARFETLSPNSVTFKIEAGTQPLGVAPLAEKRSELPNF